MILSDYVELNPRVTLPKGTIVPFVSMDVITPGTRCVYPVQERPASGSGAKFAPGDTLFARITPCLENGKIAQYAGDRPGMGSTEFFVLRAREGISDPAYVYYFAQNQDVRSAAEKSMSGASGRQRAVISSLSEFECEFPPLPVQQRIAGILSAYDELIENSQRRIKILEAMARALYREWFVHFRYPGHDAPSSQPSPGGRRSGSSPLPPGEGPGVRAGFVASPLGEIPQGWEVKKLGEVADTFRGRSYRSVDLADEGGLPFLNLKCLDRDGGFRRSGLKRYTGEFKGIHVAKKGDIVMAVTDMTQERRIVARAALVPTLDNEFGIFSMDLVRIEPKPGLPKAFLYSFLRYSSFADEVKQHANGANVLHLSPDRITDYRFTAPPADLMSRLASFVTPIVEELDTLANKIDNLRRTRDLLLPRLLSGQIDVEALPVP